MVGVRQDQERGEVKDLVQQQPGGGGEARGGPEKRPRLRVTWCGQIPGLRSVKGCEETSGGKNTRPRLRLCGLGTARFLAGVR